MNHATHTVDTELQTIETPVEETVIEQPVAEIPPAAETYVAKAATVEKSNFQVTITLDSDTHEHFRALAEADDRSLNKYLARELRAAYLSAPK